MKNNSMLNTIHRINIIISISLIVLSIISLFYINDDLIIDIDFDSNSSIVLLFRVLISVITFTGAVAILLWGIILDSYISNDEIRKGLSKSNATDATLTSSNAMKVTKHIHGAWNWVGAFIVLCFMIPFVWFLLGLSLGDYVFNMSFIEIINICLSTNLYNKLVLFMVLGMFLLCVFCMSWRVIADKEQKNDENWIRQPIYKEIIAVVIFILLVLITMYFNLTFGGMYVLVAVVLYIVYFIENKLMFKGANDNKHEILSSTLDNVEPKNSYSMGLIFEDSQKVGELQYFYDFGDPNAKKELTDYDQFSEELGCFRKAQSNKDFSKLQPVVNVWIKDNNINGITTISAFYDLKKSLFTQKIKRDEFSIVVQRIEEEGHKLEYWWTTEDYDELKNVFKEFIINQRTPNLDEFTII